MSKRQKFYLVLSKDKNYLHGAFDATEEGEKEAKKYMKEMEKKKKIKLYLKIK
jgi:hypothetical protein